jgi:putative endonuclease
MNEIWYVYLLSCSDNTIYTGIAKDIQKRIDKHNKGKGARYTRGRRPVTLIKFFKRDSKSAALKLEYKIKQLSKEDKLALDDTRIESL